MAYQNDYVRINWQNEPSEATALNDVNLNKMDAEIYEHGEVLESVDSDITALQNGKVDKVTGKGLSEVSKLTITPDTTDGNFIASINQYDADGTQHNIYLRNGVIVDSALSDSSTHPVQNMVVKGALDNKVDKVTGKGLSQVDNVSVVASTYAGTKIGEITVSGVGGSAVGSNLYNGVVVDAALSNVSENPVQNKVVKEELDKKLDGTSAEEMNVRSAMMLLTPPISNNAPYVKRVVGGGIANPYLCKLNKIIGASVVWNQMCHSTYSTATANGVTITNNNDGTFTVSGLANADGYFQIDVIGIIKDHIYLIKGCPSGGSPTTYFLGLGGGYTESGNGGLTKASTTVNTGVRFVFKNGVDFGSGKTFIPQVTDLTAMFGSTIADYVNTIETQTAGSGIAWLKSYGFFTEEYYAYSANTMQSVSVSGKKNWSKNLYSESDITNPSGAGFSQVYLSAPIPAGTYTLSAKLKSTGTPGTCRVSFRKSNGDGIVNVYIPFSNNERTSVTFMATDTIYRIYFYGGSTTSAVNYDMNFTDIQIEVGSSASEYSTYGVINETTLDHAELRGLFKLDANNNLYADGDEYPNDGSGEVKYGEVDLGDLSWSKGTNTFYASVTSLMPKLVSQPQPLIAEGYSVPNIDTSEPDSSWASSVPDMSIAYHISGSGSTTWYIYIKDTTKLANMTAEQFKTSVTDLKFVYKKATPTTVELTTYTSLQNIESGGTEEFIDYGVSQSTRDVAIPCGQESEYNSGVEVPNLPTSGGKVELTYNPANGQFTWE